MPSDSVEEKAVDYDKILDHIGQFGKFQWKIFFWLSFVSGAAGLAVVTFAFTGFEPHYRCRVSHCDHGDGRYFQDDGSLPEFFTNRSISLADRCLIPVITDSSCDENSILYPQERTGSKFCQPDDLIFDQTFFRRSLVEEFGFVCDRASLRTYYNAIYMLGMLFGSFIFGWISDNYGRMNSLLIAVTTISLSGFFGAFCGGRWGHFGYGLLRLLTGMGGIGCFMVSFVLAVEHVGSRFTALIGVAIEIPFALGQAVLGLEAYLLRDWRVLQVVAHLPLLAITGIYWVVPESVRWLLANNKSEETKAIILTASKVNERQVPGHFLSQVEKRTVREKETESTSMLDVLKNSRILLRTINMSYQWFSVTLCYYGLAFASTSLSGDPFTNFFLNVLVDIPGYIFCMFVMECWGRRPILSLCQMVAGVACIGCAFLQGTTDPNLQLFSVMLSLVGKFGASAVWGIVFVYTAEMFPTVIRNQAVGTCSLVARLGGILSMLLDLLKVFWLPAPVFIMGVVATLAGFLAIFLPETLGQKLPETIEDAVSIGAKKKRHFFECSCLNIRQHFGDDFEKVSIGSEEDDEESVSN